MNGEYRQELNWVEFSKRRPPKKYAEYIVATPLYDKKEYVLELLHYCQVQEFECEDEDSIKRRYKDDWAFGEYKCGVQLLGVADQNVHYWLEGLELPKPGRLINDWLQMEAE